VEVDPLDKPKGDGGGENKSEILYSKVFVVFLLRLFISFFRRRKKMVLKVEKTERNISRCLCLSCPSYSMMCRLKNFHENKNKSDASLKARTHYEKMFCAFEKSNCIHANKGCLCGDCANFKEYGLENCTYCTHTGGGACEC
jgi:hypothetical protein